MLNTQSLRTKILDLAMRGQLTEQLPTDGTAEDLYQKIQAEKQAMIKAGKIKKEKSLPPIGEDEIPFEVPKGWKWCRLESLGDNILNAFADGPFGSNLKTDHYTSNKEVRIVQLSNVGIDGWRDNNKKYTTYTHLKTIERSEVYAGNIVIAKMMPAGRAIIVPDGIEDAFVLSSDCIKFVPNPELNTCFLCYAINSTCFHDQVMKDVHGIGRERTSLSNLKRYLIPLPPLAEQQRIVSRIEAAFAELDVIDKLQAAYHKNREVLRKKLIDAAIHGVLTQRLPGDGDAEDLYQNIQAEKQAMIKTGKIKKEKPLPPIGEDEIPFEVPKGWKWCRLGEIIKLQSGQDLKPEEYNANHIGIPYLTGASNYNDDGTFIINRWTDTPRSLANKNDILLSCKGTVGKLGILTLDVVHIARQIMGIHVYEANIKYIKYFLFSMIELIKQASKGLIPGIERNDVLLMPIPLPPLAEQQRIVVRLGELLGALG